MKGRLVIAGLLALLLAPAAAHAAAGADNYGSAAALLFSGPGTVADNTGFTVQGGEPVAPAAGCNGVAMSRTAWWRIAGTGKPITLTTAASSFDTVLAVYDAPSGVPIAGNRIACNDDDPGGGSTSKLTFPSVRGTSYLVQVGSLGTAHGAIDVRASAERPPNDDRIAAATLQTGAPVTVSNAGASQEPGETLACGAASYAATIWFTWRASAVGDAVFTSSAAFGDTVVNVYRASDGAPLGCNAGSTATLPLRLPAGDYLVQVGSKGADVDGLGAGAIVTTAAFAVDRDLDKDGEAASTDCNDNDPSIRHGIADVPDDGVDQDCSGADAVNLDRDHDGEARPGDCNDNDPAIRHGAVDVPGNAVDEDCSGSPAPYPRLESTVRTSWRLDPFRISKLSVLRAVAGSQVELRCKGRGCPFARRTIKVKRASALLPVLDGKLGKARLKRGVVLEVRVTQAGHVGVLRRVTVRSPTEDPKIEDLCTPPGGGAAKRC